MRYNPTAASGAYMASISCHRKAEIARFGVRNGARVGATIRQGLCRSLAITDNAVLGLGLLAFFVLFDIGGS